MSEPLWDSDRSEDWLLVGEEGVQGHKGKKLMSRDPGIGAELGAFLEDVNDVFRDEGSPENLQRRAAGSLGFASFWKNGDGAAVQSPGVTAPRTPAVAGCVGCISEGQPSKRMESPAKELAGGATVVSSAPPSSAAAAPRPSSSLVSSECIFDMGKPSEEDGATKIQANVGYVKSRNGVFQVIEMVVGLVAFICVESVAECRGAFNCAPPGCVHSYRFFAFVSFTSVLVTAAIFSARMLGVAHRVPVPVKYRPFAECLYLIVTIALYFFADAFMIAYHGNRLGYQCAAVLGVATLAAYCVQLALLMAEAPLGRLLPKLSAKTKAGSGAKEDDGSRLSWEPPAGVDEADGTAPQLGPVVLRPRRSSVDSGGGGGARRPEPPDSKSSSPSSFASSRSSSDCAETASVHSANFVTVNLDDVTQPPGSSEVPS
ncbi:uncharacterized protein [Dermacentor andersoni]|uniref:uncharacterized protein n=1 Tax=Dermacentor andersoni TaxID=34620 RepID=UPI003B3A100D